MRNRVVMASLRFDYRLVARLLVREVGGYSLLT
jgi:hypothetical protein